MSDCSSRGDARAETRTSSGTRMSTFLPHSSSLVYPKSRSVAAFIKYDAAVAVDFEDRVGCRLEEMPKTTLHSRFVFRFARLGGTSGARIAQNVCRSSCLTIRRLKYAPRENACVLVRSAPRVRRRIVFVCCYIVPHSHLVARVHLVVNDDSS